MFMSDVLKKEECRNEALQELRRLGVKCRPKKPKQHNVKSGYKVFKVPLKVLATHTVTLVTGQQIAIPKLVHEMCSLITAKVSTEGLFRREGSKVRQGEIKLILNGGGALDKSAHIIDIASLLKTFLRELSEPLIPYTYHELFLRSAILDDQHKAEALLLACLLLPLEHLNTLTYLLQFFYQVAQHSMKNKMDIYNLAVVVSPAIFPIEEKVSPHNAQMRTNKICEIIRILIENSLMVGILPENIIEHLGSNSSVELKKKKRRSGSLTRMFSGLKKIVGGKSGDESHNVVTPDLLLTPITVNLKKRRPQNGGISTKKKKEVIIKLPDNVLLNTPFTPHRTPVNMNQSGTEADKPTNDLVKDKKSQWFLRSKSVKNLKQEKAAKNALERRWSAVSAPNSKRTKKRNSLALVSRKEEPAQEPDYIRVPKVEYEAIKSRVTAMERRISLELETVQSQIASDNENNSNVEVDDVQNVQTVYEQTLTHSTPLSPTTDHLAKRLSRELKIRRSAEQKIIRSPSARKIGSMRRKSLERNNNVSRTQSWHYATRGSIKRGKPNTVVMGPNEATNPTRSLSAENLSCNLSGSSSNTWVSAEGFFSTVSAGTEASGPNDRASLAKLRSQNAGMVLAKAKLFDKLTDSDSSNSTRLTRSNPRARHGNKIGSCRSVDARLSYRVRALKYEERKNGKKSMSPRRRQLLQKQKLQIAKQYLDSSQDKNTDKENIPDNSNHIAILREGEGYKYSPRYATPRAPPHIKRSLNVKSPKRLCRTPLGVDRSTPLRALKTPLHGHV